MRLATVVNEGLAVAGETEKKTKQAITQMAA